MPAEATPDLGACDCGDAGRFHIDDRRWCHRCHAEMRCALERLAEVVRSAVVARRLSPRAVEAMADRIATGRAPPAPQAVPTGWVRVEPHKHYYRVTRVYTTPEEIAAAQALADNGDDWIGYAGSFRTP